MLIHMWALVFSVCRIANLQDVSITEIYTHKAVDQWQEGVFSSPAYVERDGKGVIVGSSYWNIYAVNADDAELLWEMRSSQHTEYNERFETGAIVLEDVYQAGDAVVVFGGDNAQVTVWDVDDGRNLQTRTVNADVGRRVTNIAAVRYDNEWNIVVGLPTTNLGKYSNTWLLDKELNEIWRRPIEGTPEAQYTMGVFGFNQGFVDLNNNGDYEIVVPSDDYSVSTWDKSGVQFPANEEVFYNSEGQWAQVVFSRDYTLEFRGWAGSHHDFKPFFAHGIVTGLPVIEGHSNPFVVISGLYGSGFDTSSTQYEYHTVFVLNHDRTRMVDTERGWDWTLAYEGCSNRKQASDLPYNGVPVSYADLNGNGFPELIFPCTDGRVHAVGLDKQNVGNFPFDLGSVTDHYRGASEVSIFQRSGECPTLVFTTFGQRDEAPKFYGEIIVLSCEGNVIERMDLPTPIGDHNNGAVSGVTLFFKSYESDGNLYAAVMTQRSGLVLYELENTAGAQILWQTQRGNFRRNAIAPAYEPYELLCDPQCQGHSSCIFMQCVCDPGWSGKDCSTMLCFGIGTENSNVCNGQGDCTAPNTCVCHDYSKFHGEACHHEVFPGVTCFGKDSADQTVCSGSGQCGPEIDKCSCDPGLEGDECETEIRCNLVPWNDPQVCHGNGYCATTDKCLCQGKNYEKFTGNWCQTPPKSIVGTAVFLSVFFPLSFLLILAVAAVLVTIVVCLVLRAKKRKSAEDGVVL